MKPAVAELKWFQFRQRIIDWQKNRRGDQLDKVDRAEERSIRILQRRYGFTKEQATYQLHKYYSKARLE
jgi:hypothetical protein